MVETWICPEIGHNFQDNFAVMMINHIYNNWSYSTLTGELSALNKPPIPSGQNNTIDFRAGVQDDFKTLEVTCLESDTNVVDSKQIGRKSLLLTTGVMVTCKAKIIGRDDVTGFLRLMNQEIGRICGQYVQQNQTGEMFGIKDLRYQRGRPQYSIAPIDRSDKSEWSSLHTILMWYELRDIQE